MFFFEVVRIAAVALTMLAVLLLAGTILVLCCFLSINDALFERRMIWLSWPATAAIVAVVSWYLIRVIRAWWVLVAALKARTFICPYCGARLPRWDGVFRNDPNQPDCVDWVTSPPLAEIRFRCERCRRESWFYAWGPEDVTHYDWTSFGRGVVVHLDEP